MPEHVSYYDQVKNLVGQVSAASEDGKFTPREILEINAKLTDAALHVLDGIEKPDEHFNELVTDCERLFDELIVPYDIPVEPDWIESYVESAVRAGIRPMLAAALDAMKQNKAA